MGPLIDEGTLVRTASQAPGIEGMRQAVGQRAAPASRLAYVNKVGDDGWLRTRLGENNPPQYAYLCKYTALDIIESRGGRTYFRPRDGTHAGRTLRLGDANATQYLGNRTPVPSGIDATLQYGKYVAGWKSVARRGELLDQQFGTLTIGALSVTVTMNSVWGDVYSPLPAGKYVVLIPDFPHGAGMTRFYRDTEPGLVNDQVWFPIQYGDNSRYVHVGNVSEGCTTVIDLAQWANVHEALVSHRGSVGKSVGRPLVKGTPERSK